MARCYITSWPQPGHAVIRIGFTITGNFPVLWVLRLSVFKTVKILSLLSLIRLYFAVIKIGQDIRYLCHVTGFAPLSPFYRLIKTPRRYNVQLWLMIHSWLSIRTNYKLEIIVNRPTDSRFPKLGRLSASHVPILPKTGESYHFFRTKRQLLLELYYTAFAISFFPNFTLKQGIR